MKLNKENRWLIIFASISLMVGLLVSILVTQMYKPVDENITELFGDDIVVKLDKSFETTDILTKKEIVENKDKEVIGYVYTATSSAANIPGVDESKLTFLVGVTKDGKVKGVIELENNHTPGFYEKYIAPIKNIKNVNLDDFQVDLETGSTQSHNAITEIINAIRVAEGGYPIPSDTEEEVDPLEAMFGEDAVAEVDETFEATEEVIKKEIIKNANGDVLGYTFTATGLSDKVLHDPYHNEKETLTIMVGISLDGKVKGVYITESNHTVGFYDRYEDQLGSLVDVEVDDLEVDITDVEATVSGDLINRLLNAVKLVASEDVKTPIQILFGDDAVAEVDTSFTATEEIIEKVIVKDAEGNDLGYAYTATGLSDVKIPQKDYELITLLVGIGTDGKIKGVYVLETNHTPDFFGKYEDQLDAIEGEFDNLEVDTTDVRATISGDLINRLFNAIKAVEGK